MRAFERVPESLLAFKNLSYTVTVPSDASADGGPSTVQKTLLSDVQGYVKSGSLLALMGLDELEFIEPGVISLLEHPALAKPRC